MFRQQARISWLKESDRNTKFFHHAIQRRRARNNIRKFLHHGKTILELVEIKNAFFFQHYRVQFFKRKMAGIFFVKKVRFPIVTQEDNVFMTKEVSEQELENVLMQSNSEKSPGPDGLNARALKAFWHILKDDMLQTIQTFMLNGELPNGMNSSFISLIPKVKFQCILKILGQ